MAEVAPRNWGLYLTADQRVYSSLRHDLCVFAQVNAAPKKFNENNYYAGLGMSLLGVFSKQKRDALGFAVAHAGLNRPERYETATIPGAGSGQYTPIMHWEHETVLELYYKYRFNENFALQPDIQYVIHPAGVVDDFGRTVALNNALACMLRLHVNF
jgi:porin